MIEKGDRKFRHKELRILSKKKRKKKRVAHQLSLCSTMEIYGFYFMEVEEIET